MSVSKTAIGFCPPDEKWKKMKAVWDACVDTDVLIPSEVMEFFGDEEPDDAGVTVDLGDALEDFAELGKSGFDVILSKLPGSIDRIRFYNSW